MDVKKTGDYLASLRRNREMTQQQAADALGVSNKTVSKWESGAGLPDIGALPALAELYGVTADDILAGETRPRKGAVASGEVTAYLERRGRLRFSICYALAVLCAVASWVFSWYTWALIPLAAVPLCLWIGWSRCSGETLRLRLLGLVPLTAFWLLAVLARDGLNWETIYRLLPENVTQGAWVSMQIRSSVLWLLLLVVLLLLYIVGSIIAKCPLLSIAAVRRTALLGWILLLAAEGARILLCWESAVVYATANTIFTSGESTVLVRLYSAFKEVNTPCLWVRWGILGATLVTMAILALRQRKRAA